MLVLLLMGLALMLGHTLRDPSSRGWWPQMARGPHKDAPERVVPRTLRGGNALHWDGRHTEVDRSPTPEGHLQGQVTHVLDGDTIEVGGRPIRLADLNCAEVGSVSGDAATRRMKALVSGQRLSCELTGETSYDRWIGTCRLSGGQDVATAMIREGVCRR